ncbi:hypothetical protein GCM10022419_108300 [Nonomuraea rosea]|uniref:Uncharacterized protein n=1 Tax=Nonomuraea rosea TaxID=638574 RepID=A0ABP6ZD09_9ACTN
MTVANAATRSKINSHPLLLAPMPASKSTVGDPVPARVQDSRRPSRIALPSLRAGGGGLWSAVMFNPP